MTEQFHGVQTRGAQGLIKIEASPAFASDLQPIPPAMGMMEKP